jgi:pSer/pThr/pTyr-binding forkhead associated (FHA) protein
LLTTLTISDGNTRHLQQDIQKSSLRHWGTARLGNERLLLLRIRGYDEPLVVRLGGELCIGRRNPATGEAPDIDLDAYNAQEMGVSRNHAIITVEDDAVKIKDMGSANSTFLNGQKLIAHQTRILRDGDELRLGTLIIQITFG